MRHARAAAIVTWFYAAGFGLFTIPVAIYLQRGRLPSFFGLFDMYGGPWSARLLDDAFVLRLIAFLAVSGVVAWAAWLLWKGSKVGAVLSLALLPVEAIFWVGFALPFPWLLGAVRIVLIVLSVGRRSAHHSSGIPRRHGEAPRHVPSWTDHESTIRVRVLATCSGHRDHSPWEECSHAARRRRRALPA